MLSDIEKAIEAWRVYIRQGAEISCDVPAATAYCKLGSSKAEDKDNKVVNCTWLPGSSYSIPMDATAPWVQATAIPRTISYTSAVWGFLHHCGLQHLPATC